MLIGGALAYTFVFADGSAVGDSLVKQDKVDTAKAAIDKSKEKGVKLLLPMDHLVTTELYFEHAKIGEAQDVKDIESGWQGVDIGPETVKLYQDVISSAKTILWNGPMGVFEIDVCAKGTFAVAESVAKSQSLSIIGGGDSVKALKQSGYADEVSFISTGGGASLKFIEGKSLPGVECLDKLVQKV